MDTKKKRGPVKHGSGWRIRWTDETGTRQSAVFDDHKTAAYELGKRKTHVEEVRRGMRDAAPAPKSFADLCDYWVEKRASQKRSGHHDESIIRKHLRPAFGNLRLRDIGVEQVDEFVLARSHLTKKTVANILTLFISMLRLAVDLNWLVKAPRIRKPKVRLISADFRFLRNQSEIERLLAAAKDEGEHVFILYATAIYTGMREGELAGLWWSDVDLDERLITVHRSYDGPTKAEDIRYVPILDPLLPILRAWRLKHPGQLVFTNAAGRMLQPSSRIFQELLQHLLENAGFPKSERRRKIRSYIVFHDLRHTFASHWVKRGGDLFKLQKILGHKTVQMTLRYAHLAPSAFADDYARFGSQAPAQVATVVRLPSVPASNP
jgi:integrase